MQTRRSNSCNKFVVRAAWPDSNQVRKHMSWLYLQASKFTYTIQVHVLLFWLQQSPWNSPWCKHSQHTPIAVYMCSLANYTWTQVAFKDVCSTLKTLWYFHDIASFYLTFELTVIKLMLCSPLSLFLNYLQWEFILGRSDVLLFVNLKWN